MVPKRNCKLIKEAVVIEPIETLDVPLETNMEEHEDHEEQKDHDDHESEEERHSTIFVTPKKLEVSLKMNRFDFSRLVEALKRGSSKSVTFKLAKTGNFDRVRDQKVLDA
jgi:hypothetical protein